MPTPDRLARLVTLTFSMQGALRDRFKRASDHACSMPRLAVLHFVSERKTSSMKDVAGLLGVTPPSATVIVDALVDGGLLARAHDPKDRRGIRLRLTPKGAKLLKTATARVSKQLAELYSRLSAEEHQQLIAIFEKLIV